MLRGVNTQQSKSLIIIRYEVDLLKARSLWNGEIGFVRPPCLNTGWRDPETRDSGDPGESVSPRVSQAT